MNNILVVGLGYIGLPLALRLAEIGHTVYGEDIDADRRRCIEKRISPWPDEEHIDWAMAEITLRLWAGESYDTIIFCVNVDTADCEQLLAAMQNYDLDGKLVIVESTLPLLGTDKVKAILPESTHFAYAPERLTAGRLWWNLCHLPRVIGGSSLAYELYADVTYGDIILTDLRTAELVKLAENAYRYEKIDFANRLALRCQELAGGDVWKVIDILNERLESDMPNPGAGIGGYCLGKDNNFLGVNPNIALLDAYVYRLADWIVKQGVGKRYVLLGEAYKANVSDGRNSPGHIFSNVLCTRYPKTTILYDATVDIISCDTLVIVQPHSIYKAIDWRNLQAKTVIDLCGFFQRVMALPDESERNWEYVCLGVSR